MYSDFTHLSSIKSYSPSKLVHFACFSPFLFSLLWRAVTFDRSKIWKIWKHIWNQRGLKFQKNIIWNILSKKKKSSFYHLHFSSSFSSYLKKFYSLNSSTQNYLFNEVLLCDYIFLPSRAINKNVRAANFLTYSLGYLLTVIVANPFLLIN